MTLRCCLGLQIPDFNLIKHAWDVLDGYDGQASPIHGGLTSQFTTLKGAVANIWVRIPQPTFRGLVESMTQKRQIGVRKTIQLYISKATK